MKRIKIIGLCLALLLLLVACGNGASESSSLASPDLNVTENTISSTTDSTTLSSATTTRPTTTTATTTAWTTIPTTAVATITTTTTTTKAPTTTTARPEVTVTIPEGYTFMQIARLLEQKGVCKVEDFYEVCQNYTPQTVAVPIRADRCFRMEGYLFPDTYRFYVNDDPQSVLMRMLNTFKARVGDVSDDTIVLASIIEREARSDKHMKLVSSVFHNRLDNRAEFPYLNADPTRDYVNLYITDNALVADAGKYAALYNTCGKRRGLPAGPICCPGLRAIQAAQNPAESPYFYFFYGKDYDNHYSETLEEHEQKMAEIGVCLE